MIKVKAKTTVVGGERYKKITAELKKFSQAYVSIGIHETAGAYPGGQSVTEVALWQEFGTETIPSRSFIRAALDGHEGAINSWREEMITNVLEKDWPIKKALEAMGLRIQILIQNQIKSNTPPPYGTGKGPNDAKTIAKLQERKRSEWGRTDTLIASGLLLRSIGYKVVLK